MTALPLEPHTEAEEATLKRIHTATVEADEDDGTPSWFGVKFACSGTAGDECHQWCAEGCEETCTEYGTHRWEPMPPHGESCRIVDWLDACGADDTYAGDDEPLRVGTHQIEEEWTGDDYVWRYAEAPEQLTVDGFR